MFYLSDKFMRILAFFCLSLQACISAGVIEDSGWSLDRDNNRDGIGDLGRIHDVCRGSERVLQRNVRFDTGRMCRVLRYTCCNDPKHAKSGCKIHTFSLAGIGMSDVAWHINGFIDVVLDEESLGSYLAKIETSNDGHTGRINYFWELPNADVQMSFTAGYGDEQLALEVKLIPKVEISVKKILFLCYPSSLGLESGDVRRDRWCLTPSKNLRNWSNNSWEALSPEDFWLLYYDKYFDLAERKCAGPCALLYIPTEVYRAEVQVHNYEIFTRFTFGKKDELNFLIWPSMGIANRGAIRKMRSIKLFEAPVEK